MSTTYTSSHMSMGLAHTTRMMVFIVPPVIDFYKHFGERETPTDSVLKQKTFPICYVDLGPWKSKSKVSEGPEGPGILKF